jgi:hypothetical protein
MNKGSNMNDMQERVAAALERAEIGYSLKLTRLVDGVSTYTLTYDDGTPPIEFGDNSDAYAHIAAKKRLRAATLAIEAMREPTEVMMLAGERAEIPEVDSPAYTIWRAMIDEALR